MRADDLIIALQQGGGGPRGRGASSPYHRQVYDQVRKAILDGRLGPGDRLPASRELAFNLRLARNTVTRAYEDLLAEGYVEGKVGSGTYVSASFRLPSRPPEPGAARPTEPRAELRATPSGQGREPRSSTSGRAVPSVLLGLGRRPAGPVAGSTTVSLPYDFRPGIPDWDEFPRALWHRLIGRALRRNSAELAGYGEPAGYYPLRQAIARHLAVSRAVSARPEQVVIVSGSQQALDLIARLSVNRDQTVAVEDPGYPEARRILAAWGARLRFIPVDEEGLNVPALERSSRHGPAPRLVYVTPSHQFPTGAVLSLSRRLALLGWAARHDALVLEDDYDSEFRDPARIVESLQGLDRAGRVLYVGTFSTVLFPPLRIGYVALPPGMVDEFARIKWLADRQTATLEQLALTDFLEEGHFERHLRRMRRLAASRREALREALADHLGDRAELPARPGAGMHMIIRLRGAGSADRLKGGPLRAGDRARGIAREEHLLATEAASRGVGIYPVSQCCFEPSSHPSFLLGFAAMPEERIRRGVAILAEVVKAFRLVEWT